MRVEIEGIQQGSIEVELNLIPRIGEVIKVMYGPDAEVKGEVKSVEHYINQHANDHKVILSIRPIDD
ncbi:hypothetical protein [Acinetobacter shaoyimingii]|uniref:KOW domain-containing protein n=1 Tax=Acinetobacter shaoyimingii TaxID=2715164 RepID=A0A6G8RT03_9GAMM|nr:hypothetical protein [Acinetobacter shaoyimingii]QIO05062.1 hypothetical protein G8E00_03285 [Acinetobacter shaoyimingii]